MTRSSPAAAALALVAAAIAAPWPAEAAPEPPLSEVLPGGIELLVLPVRFASTASLRFVVRAGSAHDPAGKEGVAHLVEHLVLQARGSDGRDILEAARAAGARVNALTSRDATTFVLDAPAGAFPTLAERYLRAITSPRLDLVDVERELRVIGREDEYSGQGALPLDLVADALFRTRAIEGTIIGGARSRDRIQREDLVSFYQHSYSSAAVTLILAGAVTHAQARALVDAAVLLPPALPAERPPANLVAPELPVNERIRAPFLAAIFGFRIDASDRATCRPLAELVHLRLALALTVREPLLRAVDVACVTLRGTDFLLAFGYAPTLEATDLPEEMERTFRSAVTRAPNPSERRLVELRMARLDDRLRAHPAALADAAAEAAGRPRDEGMTPLPSQALQVIPVSAVRSMARRAFVDERRVLVFLSPFEG